MPLSPSGVYTLPSGYLAVTGQDVLPSNHNPPLEDIAAVLSEAFYRTGVAPMLADLNMNTFNIVGLADGVAVTDAATVGQVNAVQPSGLIYGLRCSNAAGDPSNDITVQSGVCASVLTGYALMTLGTITKRLDAGWAAGNNQGMLDTGVVQNTTYHLYVIKNMTTGATDLLASLSPSTPTLPSGYTEYRRIWSIIRSGGANRQFRQYGDICKCTSTVAISGTTPYGAQLTNMSVPSGLEIQPIFVAEGFSTATILVSAGDANLGTVDAVVASGTFPAGASQYNFGGFLTNVNGQIITSLATDGTITSFAIRTKGWIDTRGRYGANG